MVRCWYYDAPCFIACFTWNISSRTKLEIRIQCPPALLYPLLLNIIITSTAWWCKSFISALYHHSTFSFSFLHSFMDGCSSFWLLLLNDVCWHHKIWGITSLLWHSMMHYWLLRYFLRLRFFWFSFHLLPSHFIAFQTLLHTQTHILWLSLLILTLCVIYSSSFLFILSFNFHNLIINITVTLFVHVHLFSLFIGVHLWLESEMD